jgi:hypothetical protein
LSVWNEVTISPESHCQGGALQVAPPVACTRNFFADCSDELTTRADPLISEHPAKTDQLH